MCNVVISDLVSVYFLSLQILCQCLEEVSFDRALLLGEFKTAEKHTRHIATFDRHSAACRSDYQTICVVS